MSKDEIPVALWGESREALVATLSAYDPPVAHPRCVCGHTAMYTPETLPKRSTRCPDCGAHFVKYGKIR